MTVSTATIDRRVRRESRLLLRDARRGLRRQRDKLPPSIADKLSSSTRALDAARENGDSDLVRSELSRLDSLVEEHLSFSRKSTVREYAESIGIAIMIALVLRAFVVEAFKIPSGSMIPTMQIGDHIFVNKFIYGLRIPYTEHKILELRGPRRGEVVVFVYPCDRSKDFIKRIVALAGDQVEVRCSQLYVNGEPVPQEPEPGTCSYWDHDENKKGFGGKRSRESAALCPNAQPGQRWAECRCSSYVERHSDEVYHTIYDPHRPAEGLRESGRDFPLTSGGWRQITRQGETLLQPQCTGDGEPGRSAEATRAAEGVLTRTAEAPERCGQRSTYTVPDGHVFVMGDNRDQSSDSRFWGPVPLENIKGKALFIWWATRPAFAGGIQWDRMGKFVH